MSVQHQSGDAYLRHLANFIRLNERSLAEAALVPRRKVPPPSPSPLSWLFPVSHKALVLSTDLHHLFYVLMRLEASGFDVGTLDVQVISPSRPMSYAKVYAEQKNAETLSLASIRSSLSVVSRISLGGTWWSRSDPPDIDSELRYIYSSFTKVPALAIGPAGPKMIADCSADSFEQNAVPLDVFKNLHRLECDNIDPRALLGWDRLSESLRSLKIKRSGLQDISDVFLGAVLDDQARRQGDHSRQRQRKISSSLMPFSSPTPTDESSAKQGSSSDEQLPVQLSPLKWAFLKHLYLPDNALTFFPPVLLPYLSSLTHLDLSSNLLVSVPPGFGELVNLLFLNLSDNLIDSVLGIYTNLGQVLSLNLSHNRLESLCGLERLLALEKVDLRHNLLEESSEISRLTSLPNITHIYVEGNPFIDIEGEYRVTIFDYFLKDGKKILLDGTHPTLFETRKLNIHISSFSNFAPTTDSVVVKPFEQPTIVPPPSSNQTKEVSPPYAPSTAIGAKKLRRIVDLRDRTISDLGPGTRPTHLGISCEAPASYSSGNSLSEQHHDHLRQTSDKSEPTTSLHVSAHSRHRTEFSQGSPPLFSSDVLGGLGNQQNLSLLTRGRGMRGSASMYSKSERRRSRISASVFEPAHFPTTAEENFESYRQKVESLKSDMGDSWLKVYNESQIT